VCRHGISREGPK